MMEPTKSRWPTCPECFDDAQDIELVKIRERREKAQKGEPGDVVAISRELRCRSCGCVWCETTPKK